MTHTYELRAAWIGGVDGSGNLVGSGLETIFSAPKELRGAGVGTNPEELLLAAACGCFLITLGAVLKRAGVATHGIRLQSSLALEVGEAMRVTAIHHRPEVRVARLVDAETLEKIRASVVKAENMCLVARALSGNVKIEAQLEIVREAE